MIGTPVSRLIAMSASMSHTLPHRCTARIALETISITGLNQPMVFS